MLNLIYILLFKNFIMEILMFYVKHKKKSFSTKICILVINNRKIRYLLTFIIEINMIYGIIYLCNEYVINWSELEDSSHINLYPCALFL